VECICDTACQYLLTPLSVYTIYLISLEHLECGLILQDRIVFRTFLFPSRSSANYAELLKFSSTSLSLICPISTRSVLICQKTNLLLSCILHLLCFPFSQVESIQSPCQATDLHPTCGLPIPFQYFILYNTSAPIPCPTSSFYSL